MEPDDHPRHPVSPPPFIAWLLDGEEHPTRLWALLAVLVVSLHLLALVWLQQAHAPIQEKPPVPPPMDVALVAAELPQPQAAPEPAPQPPAPPPPPKKVEPPPPKPKPVVKPPPPKPVVKKVVKPEPKPVQKSPDAPPRPEPTPERDSAPPEPPRESAHAVEAPVPPRAAPAVKAPTPVSVAHGRLLSRPEPHYPASAKSRGLTGHVKVKIWVSASAEVEKVAVVQSSGHEILDEAAVETVRDRWRFSASMKGDTPVSDTYEVVIKFTLKQAD